MDHDEIQVGHSRPHDRRRVIRLGQLGGQLGEQLRNLVDVCPLVDDLSGAIEGSATSAAQPRPYPNALPKQSQFVSSIQLAIL